MIPDLQVPEGTTPNVFYILSSRTGLARGHVVFMFLQINRAM
jgi:hypothetical protein